MKKAGQSYVTNQRKVRNYRYDASTTFKLKSCRRTFLAESDEVVHANSGFYFLVNGIDIWALVLGSRDTMDKGIS